MRCGLIFRLGRTHPAHARSSGSETLSRNRSLAGYTIDTHESEFSEATAETIVTMTVTVRSARENLQAFSALWRFKQGQATDYARGSPV
jgi:hypothetical protein